MTRKRAASGVVLLILGLLVQGLVAFAAPVTLAVASEPTRPEYVATAEPICKANTVTNRNILRGTRQDIRDGKLKRAGRKFQRATRALDGTIKSLEGLPQPSEDTAILARWFDRLNQEADLLDRVAKRLKTGTADGVGRYVLELRSTANKANNVVLTFGFEYCLLQPARYL
jgi:hypothetical protein